MNKENGALPIKLFASALSGICLPIGPIWGQPVDLPERPNVVFILIDDMGLEMSNPYGAEGLVVPFNVRPYATPRMDGFAGQGMRFENAFATPACAPTRSQFLTGRYPFRTGVTASGLPTGKLGENEMTLASILRSNGYHTGIAGKWNLRYGIPDTDAWGGARDAQREHILFHGFDESRTFVGHSIDYGRPDPESDYVPYQLNQWVLNFLSEHANQEQPFYLQYSLGLIHTPWDPEQGALAGYKDAKTPLNPLGGAASTTFLIWSPTRMT